MNHSGTSRASASALSRTVLEASHQRCPAFMYRTSHVLRLLAARVATRPGPMPAGVEEVREALA